MKVSDWFREWQLTGKVPDWPEDPQFAFWCGWLSGAARRGNVDMDQARDMALKAAEFIESQK